MSNANRDYAIVYDVKNSTLVLSRPLIFYLTDKNTSNIFVKLVKRVIVGEGIDQYTDIENASSYVLTMRVIKPDDEVKSIIATQHESESIFQFDLTEDFKDVPGKYICELTISNIVNGRQEFTTSDPFNYEVKRSILSNVKNIIEGKDTTVEKLLNDLDATKAELSSQIKEIENDVITNYAKKTEIGSPLIANTSSEMTDITKVYVYTGEESGYINGNWYVYNGSNWVSGGTYNSQGIGDKEITRDKLDDNINSLLLKLDSSYMHEFDESPTYNTPLPNRAKVLGTPIVNNGKITKLKFLSVGVGKLRFIVLEKTSDADFTVVKEVDVENCVIGINEKVVNVDVKKGQYIGVWDLGGKIPLANNVTEKHFVCSSEPIINTKSTFVEKNDGFILISYMMENIADKVEKLDDTLRMEIEGYFNCFDDIVNKNSSNANFTRIITPAFVADGVINKVKLEVENSGTVKIMTFKKNALNFTKTSSKTLNVGLGVNNIKVNMPVKKGEYLGYFSKDVKIKTSRDRTQFYYTYSGDVELNVTNEFTKRNDGIMLLAYMYDSLVNTVNDLKENSCEILGKFDTSYNLKNSCGVRPLYIQTPYPGNLNQPYHPTVLYFETGWNGYRYWMSESPYPIGSKIYKDRYENPCIHCSNDGVNWTTPIKLVNPIDDLIDSEIANGDYLSDPHLIYRDDLNRIECWYRITHVKDSYHTYILRKYSTDGVNWSDREVIYDCIKGSNEMIRSHAVIWEDNKYKFLYTDWNEKVKYGEWNGLSTWDFQNCSISDNKDIWHLDFGKDVVNNNYYMIAYSKTSGIKYYNSDDKINWNFVKTLLLTGDDSTFWNTRLYRSCAVYNNKNWLLYFTAEKDNRIATIGLMKGETLDTLEVVDGGNNIESLMCNSDLVVNGEIILNGIKIGYDGANLYFQRSDGTRLSTRLSIGK